MDVRWLMLVGVLSGCAVDADPQDVGEETSTSGEEVPDVPESPDVPDVPDDPPDVPPDVPEAPLGCDFGDAVSMCGSCERNEVSADALARFDAAVVELGREDVVVASDATMDSGVLRIEYVVAHDWYEGVGHIVFHQGWSADVVEYEVHEALEAIPATPQIVTRAEVEAAFESCDASIVYDPCTMNDGPFVAETLHYEHIEECMDRVTDARVDVRTGAVLRCESRVETCEDQDG